MMSQSIQKINKIQVAGFLLLITMPLIGNLLGIKTGETRSENRRIEKMPSLEFAEPSTHIDLRDKAKALYSTGARFIRKFNDYYSSVFAFRGDLLWIYLSMKEEIFKTNPLPQKVVKGLDGWYFPGDSFGDVIKESKGIEHFSNKELDDIKKQIIERQSWLSEKKAHFYLAVAPDKLSIYGDYLPIRKSGKKTTVEQLDSISQNSFNFIDLRKDFPKASAMQLYYKTDSHWNDLGAYFGYTALLKYINSEFPEVPILSLTDMLADTIASQATDLTAMLGIAISEKTIRLTPKHADLVVVLEKKYPVPVNYNNNPANYENRFKSNVNQLKVLVFHDSFTSNLKKYLNASFGEMTFIWRHTFDKKLIESEQPDIVIQIIVERHLEVLVH